MLPVASPISKLDKMKKFLPVLILLALFSCKQNEMGPTDDILEESDRNSTIAMRSDLGNMEQMLDSLTATAHYSHQLHWDSLYHHHDSLFWYHHSVFHHDHYIHDDHHHTWTGYDPHIDHTHHYHHYYPGHEHDSLITDHSIHQHNNHDHHYEGHDWHDHHILDSLHQVHFVHHP